MGKQFTVASGFNQVQFVLADPKYYSGGDTVVLSDAEYSALPTSLTRAVNVASVTTVSDPVRAAYPFGLNRSSSLSKVPAVAAGLSLVNTYDPARNVYNLKASNTRKLRAGYAKAMGGSAISEVVIGDSLSAGYTGAAWDRLNSWPRVYARELNTLGVTSAGTGLVRCNDAGNFNTAWAFAGTWNHATIATYSFATSSGATATWVTPTAGTVVSVYAGRNTTLGAFTISVDGAVSGTGFLSVSAGGSAAMVRYDLTGLANTTHTVVITTSSATTVIIVGAECKQTTGLTVHNVAQSGSFASTAAGGTYTSWTNLGDTLSGLKNVFGNPTVYADTISCVHIPIGGNDIHAAVADSAIITGVTAIRNFFPSADCILYVEPQANQDTPARWTTYQQSLYSLADTLDVPLFDLQDRLGGYAIENTNGLTGDAIAHLNKSGYAEWGRNVALALSY